MRVPLPRQAASCLLVSVLAITEWEQATAQAPAADSLPVLRTGETLRGEIAPNDPVIDTPELERTWGGFCSRRGRRYQLKLERTGLHFVELRSHVFDAFLVLRDGSGEVVASDDDGSFGSNALITFDPRTLEPPLQLETCALFGGGEFELTLLAGSPPQQTPGERRQEWLAFAEQGLTQLERRPDISNQARVHALKNRALSLMKSEQYRPAEPFLEQALELAGDAYQGEHPLRSQLLSTQAHLLLKLGRYREALEPASRASEIEEGIYGPRSMQHARRIADVGAVHHHLGQWKQALAAIERSNDIVERVGTFDDRAASLANYAGALMSGGQHAAAEDALRQALELIDGLARTDFRTRWIASILRTLGLVQIRTAHYEQARETLERALVITREVFDEGSVTTLLLQHRIGLLEQNLGNYQTARRLQTEALEGLESQLGPEHPILVDLLPDLYSLLYKMGNHREAEAISARALELGHRRFGDAPGYATLLSNHALILKSLGRLAEARDLLERSLEIQESAGDQHYTHATSTLAILAFVTGELGDSDGAKRLHVRALATMEQVYGNRHPRLEATLEALGRLEYQSANFARARELMERSVEIATSTFGLNHPITANALNSAAIAAHFGGADLNESWELSAQAVAAFEKHVEQHLAGLSNAERVMELAGHRSVLGTLCGLAVEQPDADRSNASLRALLRWKASLSRGRAPLAADSEGPEGIADINGPFRQLLSELYRTQSEMSRLVHLGSSADLDADERRLTLLRTRSEKLERQLAALASERETAPRFEPSSVLESLPSNSALIAFFITGAFRNEDHVLAWIARSGPQSEPITLLDLGPASRIEQHTHDLLASVLRGDGTAARDILPPRQAPHRDETVLRNRALRSALWDPLEAHLGDRTRVYLLADGFLETLPFGVLRRKDGSFLIETLRFVSLDDPSRFSGPTENHTDSGGSLLVVGGIDYGEAQTTDRPDSTTMPVWEALEGTGLEATAIFELHAAVFGDRQQRLKLLDSEPLEERLKRELPLFRQLHLATHGFFESSGLATLSRDLAAAQEQWTSLTPGLLSGLVCAGANRTSATAGDDGLLTAEEVSWLGLDGCDLVVLSACKTGLGASQSGAAMASLRRAFRAAGAKTVISSLWVVEDRSTRELMEAFYRHLWVEGLNTSQALRQAQLELLASHPPRSWAGFVLTGD